MLPLFCCFLLFFLRFLLLFLALRQHVAPRRRPPPRRRSAGTRARRARGFGVSCAKGDRDGGRRAEGVAWRALRGRASASRRILRIGGGWGQKRRTPATINASRTPAAWADLRGGQSGGGRSGLLRLARRRPPGGRARRRRLPPVQATDALTGCSRTPSPGNRHDAPACRGLRADRPPHMRKGSYQIAKRGAPALLSEAPDWL